MPLLTNGSRLMTATMTKRPRITLDVPDDVRLAMKLAAAKADKSVTQLILEILNREFASEIKDARKYMPKKTADE